MHDVWRLPAIAPWEKSCGKHPTQKPLSLLTRIIQASTRPGAWILDPFSGSSTTGIAANLLGRRYLGIDSDKSYLDISISRREELESDKKRAEYIKKLQKQSKLIYGDEEHNCAMEADGGYDCDLPF